MPSNRTDVLSRLYQWEFSGETPAGFGGGYVNTRRAQMLNLGSQRPLVNLVPCILT